MVFLSEEEGRSHVAMAWGSSFDPPGTDLAVLVCVRHQGARRHRHTNNLWMIGVLPGDNQIKCPAEC